MKLQKFLGGGNCLEKKVITGEDVPTNILFPNLLFEIGLLVKSFIYEIDTDVIISIGINLGIRVGHGRGMGAAGKNMGNKQMRCHQKPVTKEKPCWMWWGVICNQREQKTFISTSG